MSREIEKLKKEVITDPSASEKNSTIVAGLIVGVITFGLVMCLELVSLYNNPQLFYCVHGIDARVDNDMCMYDENVDASVFPIQWGSPVDAGVSLHPLEDEEDDEFNLGKYFNSEQRRPVITITSTKYPYSGIVITTVLCKYDDDDEEECSESEYESIWLIHRMYNSFIWP